THNPCNYSGLEGAWPLIDNNYLSVQVTKVPVVPGSKSLLNTLCFKKVYQAVTDDLPAAFVDGTTSGDDGNIKSLRIVEKVSGKYIKMHTRYVGAMVYILQLGHYLTLAIRMAQELVMAYEESQDLHLCVNMNGCPSSERIDGSGWCCSLETATAKCHEKMLVKDIYFYSCVFDLLTTGDANFTAAYRITASQFYRMWRHCSPEKSTGISSPAVEVVVWARVANSLSVWDLCA
uniref:Repulsive guidance molecule BMP co-receptor b n=1 Tax=Otus sunia TaxID=257818 RepID=A0A8C8EA12_9STRI